MSRLLLVLWMSFAVLSARSGDLKGKVVAADCGASMSFVSVQVGETAHGYSDESGMIWLTDIPLWCLHIMYRSLLWDILKLYWRVLK